MEKLRVNSDACIRCGACVGMLPEIFKFGEDDVAEVITEEIPEDKKEDVIDAIESCPTGAINYAEEKVG